MIILCFLMDDVRSFDRVSISAPNGFDPAVGAWAFGGWVSKVAAFLIAALLLSGCGNYHSDAAIDQSVKSPEYRREIKSLLVIANMGSSLYNNKGDNSNTFQNALSRALDQCGTQTRVYIGSPVVPRSLASFGLPTINGTLTQFKPEAILTINWKELRSNSRGYNRTSYLITLLDTETRAIVWKANASMSTFRHPGETFAEALIDGLKKDALIGQGCIAPPYDHSRFSSE